MRRTLATTALIATILCLDYLALRSQQYQVSLGPWAAVEALYDWWYPTYIEVSETWMRTPLRILHPRRFGRPRQPGTVEVHLMVTTDGAVASYWFAESSSASFEQELGHYLLERAVKDALPDLQVSPLGDPNDSSLREVLLRAQFAPSEALSPTD